MSLNRQLTKLIAGRTVKSVDQNNNLMSITFADGSIMKIKTSMSAPPKELKNSAVKTIRQKDVQFLVDFEDGTTAEITLAEVTSSVMLRDGKGAMEYAD